MPDWVKKTAKPAAKATPGEALHAALFCRPVADDGTVKRLGAMTAADDATAGEGLASRMPRVNAVLAITDTSLVAFGHGSLLGRVKGSLANWSLTEVADVSLDGAPGAAGTTVTVRFVDDTSLVVVPGSRARRFVEAYTERITV
jgi:hypothetical protein